MKADLLPQIPNLEGAPAFVRVAVATLYSTFADKYDRGAMALAEKAVRTYLCEELIDYKAAADHYHAQQPVSTTP